MSNIIVTTTIGYDFDTIKTFLNSLNSTSFKDRLIIIDEKIIDFDISNYNFEIIWEIVNKDDVPFKFIHNCNYRVFFYRKILDKYPDFDYIIFSDTRDVFFQINPFDFLNGDYIHCAMENNKIDNCKFNSYWMKSVVSPEEYESIKYRTVICGGTIIGSKNTIYYLIDWMIGFISHFSWMDIGDRLMILEQSALNVFGLRNPHLIQKHYIQNSRILTCGHSSTILRINSDGILLNDLNEPYTIIHQYDRHPHIFKMIQEKYK
jgi:hypothetical protein